VILRIQKMNEGAAVKKGPELLPIPFKGLLSRWTAPVSWRT
jgi:hypothetical protein